MPKISALPPLAGQLTGEEKIVVVIDGATYRGTVADLLDIPAAQKWAQDAEARALAAIRMLSRPLASVFDPAAYIEFADGRRVPLMSRDGQLVVPTRRGSYAGEEWAVENTDVIHGETGSRTAYVFAEMGQSNAWAQSIPSDTLLATVPIYPDHALMLSDSVRRSADPTGVYRAVDLDPLVETAPDPSLKSTCMSGWVNHFIRDHEAALGHRPTVVGFVAAIGALPYMGLKRGTPAYTGFLEALEDSCRLLRQRGFDRIVVVTGWTQGESDGDAIAHMTASRYLRQLQQLDRCLTDDIRARTGIVDTPILLVDQIASTPGDIWDAAVRQAQVMCDGVGNLRSCGPIYCYPHVTESYTTHLSSLGQTRRGMQRARATLAEICGAGWRGVRPRRARWTLADRSQYRIDFDAQTAPLRFDTSGTITLAGNANHGNRFRDGSGSPPAIASVALSGLSMTVTLSAPSTGPSPEHGYGIERNAATIHNGPVTGARGTLCDSSAHESLYGDVDQSNFCPAFILPIPGSF